MISIAFGVAIFVLLSAIALSALYLHSRLPDHQLTKETQDAVKVGVGMVVILTALLLGLLIASVKGTFDTAGRDLKHFATQSCCSIACCVPMGVRGTRLGLLSVSMWSRRSLAHGRVTTSQRSWTIRELSG
jgi:hypothetical protein